MANNPTDPAPTRPMSSGQKAYEERRAAKAGKTLEQWIDVKAREKLAEERRANYQPKRVGVVKQFFAWLGGLLDRR